jgi:hypothetical protein
MVIPEKDIIKTALEIFKGREVKKQGRGKITISEMREKLRCKESETRKN